DSWHGLLVDYCTANDIQVIAKGLRAVSDFDYELQMAQMNRRLSGVDTVFMSTSPDYSFLSSSLIKEVATHGGDARGLLPEHVRRRLVERLAGDQSSSLVPRPVPGHLHGFRVRSGQT